MTDGGVYLFLSGGKAQMAVKMDLHMHSTYSDGTLKPVELVKKCHDDEYSLIALTDHDGIGGVREAMIAGEALGIEVIPGIELAADLDGREIHVLGYYFDLDNADLNHVIEELKLRRRDRNERLLKCLNEMGYELGFEDLKQRPNQAYIGKPNFALALVRKGYISKASEAFLPGKLLESPEARAVKRDMISADEAIELILNAGGIPSLAHPMKLRDIGEKGSPEFFNNLESIIVDLKAKGLKAVECFHPSATHEQGVDLAILAGKYHLHVTQGSDFHGTEFE